MQAVLRRILLLGVLVLSGCSAGVEKITGSVHDENGPIAGAVVRIQTTEINSTTDERG